MAMPTGKLGIVSRTKTTTLFKAYLSRPPESIQELFFACENIGYQLNYRPLSGSTPASSPQSPDLSQSPQRLSVLQFTSLFII